MSERKKRETRLFARMDKLKQSLPIEIRDSAYFLMNNIENEENIRIFEERKNVIISDTSLKKLTRMNNIRKSQEKHLSNTEISELKEILDYNHILYTDKKINTEYLFQIKFESIDDREFFANIKADNQEELENILDKYIENISRKYRTKIRFYVVEHIFRNVLYKNFDNKQTKFLENF